MSEFSWIPFYTEFAEKLLEYKDKQPELIGLLKDSFKQTKLSFPRIEEPGKPEDHIDPFTVIGMFNKGISFDNRIALITALRQSFNIKAEVPTDFDGIPILNNMHAWFYRDNKYETIEKLWKIFELGMKNKGKTFSEEFIEKFDEALSCNGVKWNITMGLFWINPEKYINLDSTNRWFLSKKYNIEIKDLNGKNYATVIDRVKNEEQTKKFYEISKEANDEIQKEWKKFNPKQYKEDIWRDQIKTNKEFFKLLYETANAERIVFIDDLEGLYKNPIDLLLGVCNIIYNNEKNKSLKELNCGFSYLATGKGKESLIGIRFSDELYKLCEAIFGGRNDNEIMSTTTTTEKGGDHNIILYGPPGTGKTYSIKNRVETISGEKYDDLVKNGRLKFVTFHQSYGYEEFVEGIKPSTDETDGNGNIKYSVEPGVFKKFCDENRWIGKTEGSKDYPINDNPKVWKVSLKGTGDNDIRKECLKNDHIRIGWNEYGENITDDMDYSAHGGKNVLNAFINTMRVGDIVLSCYTNTTIDAIGIVTGEYKYNDRLPEYKRLREVQWIKIFDKEKKNIYELNNKKNMTLSTVYRLNISAADALNLAGEEIYVKNDKPCFFIIDEINRGNISKIFGELITLIEESKRDKVSVTLPYSGEEFTVPSNVYVIGTMNTADRSIALLDTALRRRFDFEEMMPDPEQLTENCDGVNLKELLRVMNERIEYLLDREHTIGHAYFMESDENGDGHSINSLDKLKDVFKKKIIPLLQEYFYDDYEKISLVLDRQFIKVKDVPNSLKDKGLGKVYEINLPKDITAYDFISIYKTDLKNDGNEDSDE